MRRRTCSSCSTASPRPRGRSSSAARTRSATRGSSSATPTSKIRSRPSMRWRRGWRSRASARSSSPRCSSSRGQASRLLDLWVQARRVLAVRPDRGGPEARQRRGAGAEGEAGEGAPDRAGPDALVRRFRRAALAVRPTNARKERPFGRDGLPVGSDPKDGPVSAGQGPKLPANCAFCVTIDAAVTPLWLDMTSQ